MLYYLFILICLVINSMQCINDRYLRMITSLNKDVVLEI